MGVGAGVEHYAVVGEPYLLDFVNHHALNVALEVFYFYVRKHRFEPWDVLFEGHAAVDSRLAHTEKVEVRAVKNKDFHLFYYLRSLLCYLFFVFLHYVSASAASLLPSKCYSNGAMYLLCKGNKINGKSKQ